MPAWDLPALWRPELSPASVIVAAAPEAFPGARQIHPERVGPILANAETENGRHLLLDDPDGPHRLWFTDDVRERGGAFVIPIDDDFGVRLQSVMRFYRRLSGKPAGLPPGSLRLTRRQRSRLVLLLRALDGKLEGETRREIAAVLFDPAARSIPAIEWKNAPLRKQVNRAIAGAVGLMKGGYLSLLRGDPKRAQRFRRP